MSIKITDLLGFTAFFLAYCCLFLGLHTLWVLPSGLILTYALTRAYHKWINPPEDETKPNNDEQQSK